MLVEPKMGINKHGKGENGRDVRVRILLHGERKGLQWWQWTVTDAGRSGFSKAVVGSAVMPVRTLWVTAGTRQAGTVRAE